MPGEWTPLSSSSSSSLFEVLSPQIGEEKEREEKERQKRRQKEEADDKIVSARVDKAIDQANPMVDLANLNLTTLPPSLAELKYFTTSSSTTSILLGGGATSSPSTTTTISSAVQLYLSYNSLTSLPSFLFHTLTNVTVLSVRHNALTSLPPCIVNLVNLKELSLGGNQLPFLPAEILALARLSLLNVTINPFLTEPAVYLDAERQLALASLLRRHSLPLAGNENIKALVLSKRLQRHLTDIRRPPSQGIPSLVELSLRVIARRPLTPKQLHEYRHVLPSPVKSFLMMPRRKCQSCDQFVVGWYIRDIQIREAFGNTVPLEFAFCSPACFAEFVTITTPQPQETELDVTTEIESEDEPAGEPGTP